MPGFNSFTFSHENYFCDMSYARAIQCRAFGSLHIFLPLFYSTLITILKPENIFTDYEFESCLLKKIGMNL